MSNERFSTTSSYSCTIFGATFPREMFNVVGTEATAREEAPGMTDAELREKILEKQRLNAYGRKGGYGGTLLHSAAYLKVLYTEWRRRELGL